MTKISDDMLRQLEGHYWEQDCPRSAIHAQDVLLGDAEPDEWLIADAAFWAVDDDVETDSLRKISDE